MLFVITWWHQPSYLLIIMTILIRCVFHCDVIDAIGAALRFHARRTIQQVFMTKANHIVVPCHEQNFIATNSSQFDMKFWEILNYDWRIVSRLNGPHSLQFTACPVINIVTVNGRMQRLWTHWGRDKRADIFQTTFSNAFSSLKMYKFRVIFHWSYFPGVQSTILQHWFR